MKRNNIALIIIVGLVVVSGIIPALVQGQVTPGPEATVDYGPTITTDKEKLFACYSLIAQMIDEHNRQGDIVKGDPQTYTSKFITYREAEFVPRLKEILAERNRLMEAIRWDNYTVGEWRKLTDEEQQTAHELLFGLKEQEKVKPTLAEAALLDDLKQIELADLVDSKGVDPIEDFTSAKWNSGVAQSDPNNRLTITANNVEVDSMKRNEDVYHYADCGAAHFDGDFEHLLEVNCSAIDASGSDIFWAVANLEDEWQAIIGASGDELMGRFYRYNADYKIMAYETDGGVTYNDQYVGFSTTTWYWLTIERDEVVGTYGTFYIYIYSDASRETLVDTLSVALHSSKKDYRYAYSVQGYNTNNVYAASADHRDLDLQEVADEVVGYSFGYIIGG